MTRDQGRLFAADGRMVRRSRRATDQTITELRKQGRLEAEHVGMVAMLRTLADCIDDELAGDEPNKWTIARLAAEWRAVHGELRGQADTWDAQLAAFFEDDVHGAPAVRDTT